MEEGEGQSEGKRECEGKKGERASLLPSGSTDRVTSTAAGGRQVVSLESHFPVGCMIRPSPAFTVPSPPPPPPPLPRPGKRSVLHATYFSLSLGRWKGYTERRLLKAGYMIRPARVHTPATTASSPFRQAFSCTRRIYFLSLGRRKGYNSAASL